MTTFHNDDKDYARWLEHHGEGYVVHLRPGGQPPMLHTARCHHLYPAEAYAGRATTTPKVCDTDRERLQRWVAQQGYQLALCATCQLQAVTPAERSPR